MRRVRKQKNIIISLVMLALFTMTVGFAIYQKKLDIGGVANINWKDWNIRILSIENVESSSGVDVVKPSHTNTTAKFNSKITKVGGFIKYKIVVKNSGTIDGVLGAINIEDTSNSVITYTVEGTDIDDELLAGEERTIYVTATYDSSKVDTATTNKSSVSINLNYVQLEGYIYQNKGYLAIRDGSEDYWISEKLPSNSIESISFTTSKEIPSDVGDNYFDASQEQNGSIMGYFYDKDADGLYEVYVGQKDGVMANPNSAYLFMNIENLTSVDVEHLNTSEVTEMALMFANNYYLTSLDLSSWDTSNVESMTSMFGSCEGLQSINVLGWDTSKVLYMDNIFYNLPELKEIDLSTWNTSNVYYMNYMFYSNYSLERVYVSDLWSTASADVSFDMFTNASNIVGSSGTTYDENNVDATMANYQYGYLTYKETENSKVVPGSTSLNGHGVVSGKLTMLDNNGNGEITFYWYDPSSANTTDTITVPFIFLLDDGGSDCARYDDDLIITYDSKGLGSATITVTDLYEDTYNYTEFVAVNNIFELP